MKGQWRWALHRLAGLALLPLLFLHLRAWHLPGRHLISFAPVNLRLGIPGTLLAALALVVLAVFHGLAGLRNVLADWWPLGAAGERRLTAALWLAGILLVALGGWGLVRFTRG